MYSQSTSGSTQPGVRPVTARCGDVLSTWQHSIIGHATEDEESQTHPLASFLLDPPLAMVSDVIYYMGNISCATSHYLPAPSLHMLEKNFQRTSDILKVLNVRPG